MMQSETTRNCDTSNRFGLYH